MALPKGIASSLWYLQQETTTYLHLSLLEPDPLRYHRHYQAQYCIVPPAKGILVGGLTLRNGMCGGPEEGGHKIGCSPCEQIPGRDRILSRHSQSDRKKWQESHSLPVPGPWQTLVINYGTHNETCLSGSNHSTDE